MKRLAPLALAVACLSAARGAADPPAPTRFDLPALPPHGHSMHGEAFNEGPRQFATLLPGTGDVHFEITTKSSDAQRFFNQGVGQIHGFWYFEAERSFRQVAYLDPDCALAYWGMAMANINNPKRATQLMKEAAKRRDKASAREQRWVDAWVAFFEEKPDERARRGKLVRELEELVYDFPDDVEAKAFLVFQLWENSQHNVSLPSRLAVDALAQQALTKAPLHPGVHHYLIHLWNHKEGDKRAVASAARCGQSAPGIAHLWHMSGHTFSELKRYEEATWQQEASARVDHASMQAARLMPEQIHNYAHNNDWLVKNLAYIGRVHSAVDLAKNLIELPRLGPGKQQAWRMGRDRLLETLVTFELWDELIALESTMYLAPDEDSNRETARLRALGAARFARGDREQGQQKLDELKALRETKRAERIAAADKAGDEAEKARKPDVDVTKAMAEALRGFASALREIDRACAELRMYRALAVGNRDEARKQLALASDIPSIRGAVIRAQLGDFDEAIKLARDNVKSDKGQVHYHAVLADTLARAGKQDEAIAVFKALRERSAQLDLDVPAFQRLGSLVSAQQLPTDWRSPLTVAPDAGQRPDLAQLGPFRWTPMSAPALVAPRDHQQPLSLLSEYRGKPVLVVFYLGAGCAHCIEQLNALAPQATAFKDAGIDIVAVSTDSPDGLHQTFSKAKDAQGFPFPIVSDHGLTAFKTYRAFDDFENIPLHGTFLVDPNGLVRWQNISYQPFTDVTWLLQESKRLLAIPAPIPNATVARDGAGNTTN